ncbi:hypothetical protein [Streptomyces iranensis]|uniref:Uncharacterized protein n=1 Tax=Streptomyces iranensis TaxID=576784 RepID=A0A060ZRU0_9ACTN|nr:hypothetical protein [Streptomyces iranensis]MBP2066750.1 hypothetical protein [Streptomyces iranensis]CDR08571.1 predicted protein [Streptomyces iranensis]
MIHAAERTQDEFLAIVGDLVGEQPAGWPGAADGRANRLWRSGT